MITSPTQLNQALKAVDPQLVIWDFDGTLVDTEPYHAESYASILAGRGITPEPNFFQALVGNNEPTIWSILKEKYNISDSIQQLKSERIKSVTAELVLAKPNWFVLPALEWLKAKSIPCVIVSAGNPEVVDACNQSWGIQTYFDEVSVLGNSGDPGSKKMMLQKLAAAHSSILTVEDSKTYLSFGTQLGFRSIGVLHELNQDNSLRADYLISAG